MNTFIFDRLFLFEGVFPGGGAYLGERRKGTIGRFFEDAVKFVETIDSKVFSVPGTVYEASNGYKGDHNGKKR